MFTKAGDSNFVRIALKLHASQRAATTPGQRDAANEALAHFLRMAHAGHLDAWIAAHPDAERSDSHINDSMEANPEW